ncbi:hypothetical protein RJ55_08429 [Drechmeria coniospora]|nr:hypothetical protein RJ55_08429 [Drechmeria coniospora]
MSETPSEPATSPSLDAATTAKESRAGLSPLMTSTPSVQSNLPPPMPRHVSKDRLSQYSATSAPSRSRPQSHLVPAYPSSLPYAQVRDFAYPTSHLLHYGPPLEPSGPPSGRSTPADETSGLPESPASWDSWKVDGFNRGHDIEPIEFGDGPPYSEDEDLQSPVVATRHRRHKSSSASNTVGRPLSGRSDDAQGSSFMRRSNYDDERGYYVGTSGDGAERYYVNQGEEANGPGGEVVTYPPDQARRRRSYPYPEPVNSGEGYGLPDSGSPSSTEFENADESRYSRDYQFTITSPDEEFHGKAVALFDFERENENELPLVEGQIIWVSYRHGQGWLVAEDPKTQENGLVPEEYVRLLRDIEGGMNSLISQPAEGPMSPNEAGTPTQAEHGVQEGHRHTSSNPTNGYHQPVVSVFSTSSKDLNPYPTEQLGIQAGQTPPQVIHYHGQRGGSQTSTPTMAQYTDPEITRSDSQDLGRRGDPESPVKSPIKSPVKHVSSPKATGPKRDVEAGKGVGR